MFGSVILKERKEALSKKYNLREFSEEEKELMQAFQAMVRELQKEKGYLDEEDEKELKKRLKAWMIEHGHL